MGLVKPSSEGNGSVNTNIVAGDYINYKMPGTIQISINDLGYLKIFKKIILFNGTIRFKFDLWDSQDSISHAQICVNSSKLQEYTATSLSSVSTDINVQENDVLELECYSETGICNIKNIILCSNKKIPLYINSI